MPFTPVTVTATYLRPDNVTPAQGQVTFRLLAEMRDGAGQTVAKGETVTVTLDVNGHISQVLQAVDDTTTQPVGVTWEVREVIDGVHAAAWRLAVPHTAGTLDLATVAPALPAAAAYGYATTTALNAETDRATAAEAALSDLLAPVVYGGTPSSTGSTVLSGGTPAGTGSTVLYGGTPAATAPDLIDGGRF